MKPNLENFLSLVKENQDAFEKFQDAVNQRKKILERIDLIQSEMKFNQVLGISNDTHISSKKTSNDKNESSQNVEKIKSTDENLIARIKRINQKNKELLEERNSKKIVLK